MDDGCGERSIVPGGIVMAPNSLVAKVAHSANTVTLSAVDSGEGMKEMKRMQRDEKTEGS